MSDLMAALREAVTPAIARTDTAWALNRPKAMERTREAVLAAIEPVVARAIDEQVQDRLDAEHMDAQRCLAPEDDARADLEHAAGYRAGHQAALIEAATMLKRARHRSAVTRVLELADAPVVVPQTPARPQPVNASPADGPGSPASAGVAPEPTESENGAQRGVQGLQEAIDAASTAECERRERDAWIGHAPTSPRARTYAARLAAAGDEARDG